MYSVHTKQHYLCGALLLVILILCAACQFNPHPATDPIALPPKAISITYTVKNYIVGTANEDIALYDFDNLQQSYNNLWFSCPPETPKISAGLNSTWPDYAGDAATGLRDNFMFMHDVSKYDATELLLSLREIDGDLSIPLDDDADWDAEMAEDIMYAVRTNQTALIDAGVWEPISYTDAPDNMLRQFKQSRPIAFLFKKSEASDGVDSWYGVTSAYARMSIINTTQMYATCLAHNTPSDPIYLNGIIYQCTPDACSDFRDYLYIAVRNHELWHHLTGAWVYHHDCNDEGPCAMRSYNCMLSEQKWESQFICSSCWSAVPSRMNWNL